MSFEIQTLIEKLNPTCRRVLEQAAELCLSQTHFSVELEHLLLSFLKHPDCDFYLLLTYYNIRPADLQRELTRVTAAFRRGNSRPPTLTPHILRLLEQSWLLSTLFLKVQTIRSGAILISLLEQPTLRGIAIESAPVLKRIPRDSIKQDIFEVIKASEEERYAETAKAPLLEEADTAPGSKALDQYTIDLTQRARDGLIDPIVGREREIRQIIDILVRRRQNNPILTGEAGVGKTAVVEGLALRIAHAAVPPMLADMQVRLLDLSLLQAGAGLRGEFEKRLKAVVDEVKHAVPAVILFIDEAHMLIGAGGPAGIGDAASMLKPALARGELRTIAATTWAEYKKYFEKDSALARRFQVIRIDEPDESSAIAMLQGVATRMERHHGVSILDEAVRAAVRLSSRYMTGRQQPDKAVSVLDTACARVAVGQTALPASIESCLASSERLKIEISVLEREQADGAQHTTRIDALKADLAQVEACRQQLILRWEQEKALVEDLRSRQDALREKVRDTPAADVLPGVSPELTDLRQRLAALQGDAPMVPVCVDSRMVEAVVADWTGIPAGKLRASETQIILTLEDRLAERIIGQPQALEAISRRIRTYRADLDDPGKPVGVFLLVGPGGVGKTHTAAALADILYGGEHQVIAVHMAEFQEAYSVSALKGSPPGYVGHGKGGRLTEAVRRSPYSVVLLDEIEKAHPDVLELFYPVFDKGCMEDAEGLAVDFKNTVILLTSTVDAEVIQKACGPQATAEDREIIAEKVRTHLSRQFKSALLQRVLIVVYTPLENSHIQAIAHLKLQRLKQRLAANHKIELEFDDLLAQAVAGKCASAEAGARKIDQLLAHELLPELSGEILKRMSAGEDCSRVHLKMDASGRFHFCFEQEVGADENSIPPIEDKETEISRAIAGLTGKKRGFKGLRKAMDLKAFFKR